MAVTMTRAERPDPASLLDAWGGVRRTKVLTESDTARWAALAASGGACPVEDVRALLADFSPTTDIQWWRESDGLPAGAGLVLDLEDRASPCGGLLLAIEGDRLTGWRPEAGALTVFSEGALILSPVVPGAPERRAIVGRLA